MTLPVASILPELKESLSRGRNAVLQAPPGAGKTTVVPLELRDAAWLQNRKIILLQPRRLATRAAARRMAGNLHEDVGQQVGYRVRFDNQVGPDTRIEVVTEAILTRKLQQDPEIADTGLVIFDEFHERSIHSDLGLALCREVQEDLRTDLRILVMSATMDGEPVARLLGGARIISCSGKQYPVETHYLSQSTYPLTAAFIAAEISRIIAGQPGSALVFLPGAGEIRRVAALLAKRLPPEVEIAPLFGDLSGKKQDRAIRPCARGRRKVVLATSIAETSLTIEGIRIVVDAGQMRIPRFHPGSLMTSLETIRVSKASADQRRGRAGRTGPGTCFRLWTEHDHRSLVPHTKPEILSTDLASLTLEMACWGNPDINTMAWLDLPPRAALGEARNFLCSMGALDAQGRVTPHGRSINALGIHPRLGHMILKSAALGQAGTAAKVAALLSRRDILARTKVRREADIRLRLEMLTSSRRPSGSCQQQDLKSHALIRTRQLAQRWLQIVTPGKVGTTRINDAGRILALAYPDRIGKLRPGSRDRYLLSGGRGACLHESDPLSGTPFIVAARTDGRPENARIFLAAPVEREDLEQALADRIDIAKSIQWDSRRKRVLCREQRRIGQVVLDEKELKNPDKTEVCSAIIKGIREAGLDCLSFSKKVRNWIARVQFIHDHGPKHDAWPDMHPAALLADLENWLGPYLGGYRSLAPLKKLDLQSILGNLLDWQQRRKLDRLAPEALQVPSGSRIRLDYTIGDGPILAVRLQEMFGLQETPTVLEGHHKVLVHLLSPAGRPVQVTRDLSGFWRETYGQVKKELKGRYPKHYWPENPLEAVATRNVKPKRPREG